MSKRQHGAYYTLKNPFHHPAFLEWAGQAGLPHATVLEPFAGANSLIGHLRDMDLCRRFASFDVSPASLAVVRRDTLHRFPSGFHVCVTNPPWLARNSATRRGLRFPDCEFDDLYKFALQKCLDNCRYVAALVPESFIRSGLLLDRLAHFVSITQRIFLDTEAPVGLALFVPDPVCDTEVWSGGHCVGCLNYLRRLVPPHTDVSLSFNDPDGNVGLVAIDGHIEPSIRFCDPREIHASAVKASARSITRIWVDGDVRIDEWNEWLAGFRQDTHDVFLTSFKGLRKDGMYRRRLDWDMARRIVGSVK